MKTTEADKLRAAKALIEDPKNWTQGAFAVTKKRVSTDARSSAAVCWCMIGAAYRACAPLYPLYDAAAELCGEEGPITSINDGGRCLADGSTGHPAVMKIYDKAIELAEASR